MLATYERWRPTSDESTIRHTDAMLSVKAGTLYLVRERLKYRYAEHFIDEAYPHICANIRAQLLRHIIADLHRNFGIPGSEYGKAIDVDDLQRIVERAVLVLLDSMEASLESAAL